MAALAFADYGPGAYTYSFQLRGQLPHLLHFVIWNDFFEPKTVANVNSQRSIVMINCLGKNKNIKNLGLVKWENLFFIKNHIFKAFQKAITPVGNIIKYFGRCRLCMREIFQILSNERKAVSTKNALFLQSM